MSEKYEYVYDRNGNILLDKNGKPVLRVASCINDSPKESIWHYRKRIERERLEAERLKMLEKKKKAEERKRKRELKKALLEGRTIESSSEELSATSKSSAPHFHSKIMFNDAGIPITMQNGYSSEDIEMLYEEHENE